MSWKDRLTYCKNCIKNNWRTAVIWSICFLTALMWAAAAFGKLKDLDDFRYQLGESPLLQGFEETAKWTVPYGELLLAIVLINPTTRLLALYTSVFLLSLFIVYIITLLQFSYYDIPCACSGFAQGLSWEGHLVFNAAFMSLAISGIFIDERKSAGFAKKRTL